MEDSGQDETVTLAESEDNMTNYQGVRRLKNYLKRKCGISSKNCGCYKRYSGYERLYYTTLDDVSHEMVIHAYTDSVWISFRHFDEDNYYWLADRTDVIPLDEFRKIGDARRKYNT